VTAVALRRLVALVSDCRDLGRRPFVALESVEAGTGRLVTGELVESDAPRTGAAAIEPGTVLFGKLRPYLAKRWLVDRPVYASTELLALRPRDDINGRWLAYVCGCKPLIEWSVATSDGTKMPRTTWEKLGEFRLDVPPLMVQQEIADFLDAETARIDGLIEKKRQLLNLISLRRHAAISEAIDSVKGEPLPLRRVVESFIDYRGATPETAEGGVPLVTATNVSDGEIDFSLGERFLSEETYVEWMRRGFPEVGDVLLTTEAPLGEVAMITNPRVALAQRIILLKPNRQRVESDFLYASLRSPQVQADLLSRASGSTVWGIRADRLRDVQLCVPSLSEQEHVVRTSQAVDAAYRRARGLLREQMGLLREHRQALITAAVTGELEFAKAAA
jgi:type I restriction enzyme S subunit